MDFDSGKGTDIFRKLGGVSAAVTGMKTAQKVFKDRCIAMAMQRNA